MKLIRDRLITWSFCYEPTEEFRPILALFKKWLPTYTCRCDVSETDKKDIYEQSLFVLVQDMDRMKEVLEAGAIPVCVGPTSEDVQVIVYESTAEKAIKRCMRLMKDPDMLQRLQTSLLGVV